MPIINIDHGDIAAMPWGKYRDRLLEDVPGEYLRWVLRSEYASPDLRKSVESEMSRRRTAPGTVEYVKRGNVVHLSVNGDLPACGSLYRWKSRDSVTSHWPGGNGCRRGCFS